MMGVMIATGMKREMGCGEVRKIVKDAVEAAIESKKRSYVLIVAEVTEDVEETMDEYMDEALGKVAERTGTFESVAVFPYDLTQSRTAKRKRRRRKNKARVAKQRKQLKRSRSQVVATSNTTSDSEEQNEEDMAGFFCHPETPPPNLDFANQSRSARRMRASPPLSNTHKLSNGRSKTVDETSTESLSTSVD